MDPQNPQNSTPPVTRVAKPLLAPLIWACTTGLLLAPLVVILLYLIFALFVGVLIYFIIAAMGGKNGSDITHGVFGLPTFLHQHAVLLAAVSLVNAAAAASCLLLLRRFAQSYRYMPAPIQGLLATATVYVVTMVCLSALGTFTYH